MPQLGLPDQMRFIEFLAELYSNNGGYLPREEIRNIVQQFSNLAVSYSTHGLLKYYDSLINGKYEKQVDKEKRILEEKVRVYSNPFY